MRKECNGREIFDRHQNRGQFAHVQAAEGPFRSGNQHCGKRGKYIFFIFFFNLTLLFFLFFFCVAPLKKAESQLAYELQAAKIRQRIRNEEIQIDIVERRKQIEIESKEVERKERELKATVRLPADAENYRTQMIAEGKRTQTLEAARADAERIKQIGLAEASAIEVVGKAEAEKMRMKANVFKTYGDAAIMSIVLDALPKVTTNAN